MNIMNMPLLLGSIPVHSAEALEIFQGFLHMGHFVYIIQSEKDGSFYIGSSSDPVLRLQKHNAP